MGRAGQWGERVHLHDMRVMPAKSKPKSRSGPTIPESERAKRGQVRVRLSAAAMAAIDSAALPGEYRQDTANRLVILGAEASTKTGGS